MEEMIETALIILAIIGISASAYLFGENRRLKEWNRVLRDELPDWQNKALVQRGKGVLGQERKVPSMPKNENPLPKVVSRADLQRRAAEESRTSPVTINAEKIVPPVVLKAKEILENK